MISNSSRFQIAMASLSFVVTALMSSTIMKRRSGRDLLRGLTNPYRRIILGMSISDAIRSIALISGPCLVSYYDKDGNSSSALCQLNGFLSIVGLIVPPMYTSVLCLYYLCKLKHRMTDESFYYKFELRMHITIISFSVFVPSVALGFGIIHPTVEKQFCAVALGPNDYVLDVLTTNIRSITSSIFLLTCFACLIGIGCIMMLLVLHAMRLNTQAGGEVAAPVSLPTTLRNAERTDFEESIPVEGITVDDAPRSFIAQRMIESNVNEDENQPNESGQLVEHLPHRQHLRHLSKMYRDEMLIQAGCYVGAFCIIYVPILLSIFILPLGRTIDGTPSPILLWMASIFYPLGGVLNVLVYTRPKAVSLRWTHQEYSYSQAFWLVIKAGGEIPPEEELMLESSRRSLLDYVRSRCRCLWCHKRRSVIGSMLSQMSARILSTVRIGDQDVVSDIQYGVASSLSLSPDSIEGVNGLSASFEEDNLMYRAQEDWFYVIGGSVLHAVQEEGELESIDTIPIH